MKLRLLVLIGLLTSLLVSAQAQTSNNDVAFVDAQGKVIPNGTTVVLNAVKEAMFPPGWKEIAGEVYIKNTSDKDLTVTLYSRINSVDEGNVTVCALGGCTPFGIIYRDRTSEVTCRLGEGVYCDRTHLRA